MASQNAFLTHKRQVEALTGREYPHYLPLPWEVTVTRRDTKDERIEVSELVGIDNRVLGLGWGVQLAEHL